MSDEKDIRQDDETLEKVQALLDDRIEEKQDAKAHSTEHPVEEPAERLETERSTTFDSNNFTQSAMYSWSMQMPDLQHVEVSDNERTAYLKAFLHDKPVRLKILLEMGDDNVGNATFDLRTINNYETDLVFQSIELDRKEGLITGHHQLATRLQNYAGAMQVEAIQSVDCERIEFPEPGDVANDINKLRAFVNKRVGKMHFARWQGVLAALRIFETKIKICNDAALNGNFWTPQDVD